MIVVDTHTHVVSDDEEAYPLQPRGTTGPWYRDDPCSVERLLSLMDESGVDRVVLVQGMSAYHTDNRYTADSARRFPERCTSVGYLELAGPDPVGVLRQLVEVDGMRGLRWVSLFDGQPLEEPAAVWQTAVALAAFPNLHLKVSSNVLEAAEPHGDVRDLVCDLAARFGAERLMWGSDYSQTHNHPYPELVARQRHAASRLRDDEREWYLGRTALTVWPELAG